MLYAALDAWSKNRTAKTLLQVIAWRGLEATVERQCKDFENAVAELKGQIRKVSAQIEVNKPSPQTVLKTD